MSDVIPVVQLAKERALFRFSALAVLMLQEATASIGQASINASTQHDQKTTSHAKIFLQEQGPDFLKRLNGSYAGYVERGMQTMYRDLRKDISEISAETLTLIDDDTMTRHIEVERRVLRLRDADQQSLSRLNLIIAKIHGEYEIRERENPFRPYLMARALHDVLCGMVGNSHVCTMLFDHLSGALCNHLPEYFAAVRKVFETHGVHAQLLARPSAMSKREREMLQIAPKTAPNMLFDGGVPNDFILPAASSNATNATSGSNATGAPSASFAMGGSGAVPATATSHSNAPTIATNSSFPSLAAFSGAGPATEFPSLSSPALEHVVTLLEQNAPASTRHVAPVEVPVAPTSNQAALQDLVWKIFNQSAPGRIPVGPRNPDGPNLLEDSVTVAPFVQEEHPLVARLQQMQNKVLLADALVETDAFKLNEALGLHIAAQSEQEETDRVAADVVAMLFNFIAVDELIPPRSRTQIARLQAPFLKAAILDAEVLQSPTHPARKLLNRVVSLSIGLDEDKEPGATAIKEITKTINRILREFKNDVELFNMELDALNRSISSTLRAFDADVSSAADALEEAEKDPEQYTRVLGHTVDALRERFSTLQTDPRAEEFIIKVWSKVLAYVSQHGSIEPKPYLDAISELIWSVQINLDDGERVSLMRLLPKLAVRLREGLALIEMSDAESKQVLDALVAMHSQVLRATPDPLKYSMRLGSLIQHFAKMQIGAPNETVAALHAPMIPPARLQSALQKFDVDARAYLDSDVGTLMSEDAQWLGNMKPGTSIEWWSERGYLPATLMWVDEPQSFYLFRIDPDKLPEDHPGMLIYSSISLIKALREGSIGTIESAPVFDRAIESVLLNSEEVQQLEEETT